MQIPNESDLETDLVNFGAISAYMYKRDLSYNLVPNDLKNYSLEAHQNKKESTILWRNPFVAPTEFQLRSLMEEYWKKDTGFSVIDVGCQYGILSMNLAVFIKQMGKENHIYSFDCGLASLLTKRNIELNGLEDIITFERKAVSEKSNKREKVYYNLDFSGDNHIYDRGINLPYFEVDSICLDDYFIDHRDAMIIKIDVQGAEPLVFQGMQKILETKRPRVLFEFTPWAIEKITPVMTFLNSIPNEYTIYHNDEPIDRSQLSALIERISLTEPYWTDLTIRAD